MHALKRSPADGNIRPIKEPQNLHGCGHGRPKKTVRRRDDNTSSIVIEENKSLIHRSSTA